MGRRILPQSALRRFMIAPCLMLALSGWPVSRCVPRVSVDSLPRGFLGFPPALAVAVLRGSIPANRTSRLMLIHCYVALSTCIDCYDQQQHDTRLIPFPFATLAAIQRTAFVV
uniref:Putative secreted protein n=1 Tax=Anopheles triannulatus TaxID=58253 RepID=A0A2M4B4H2_9DIPT